MLEGHFILSSGLRSPVFLQKARVFMHADKTERFVPRLAAKIGAAGWQNRLCCRPGHRRIIPAYETSRHLGIPAIWVEREGRVPAASLRIEKGARVVIVEDIVTTGLSIRETVDCLAIGAESPRRLHLDRSAGKLMSARRWWRLPNTRFPPIRPTVCRLNCKPSRRSNPEAEILEPVSRKTCSEPEQTRYIGEGHFDWIDELILKRENPKSLLARVRLVFWPRRSFGRSFAYFGKRIARLRASPQSIAIGSSRRCFCRMHAADRLSHPYCARHRLASVRKPCCRRAWDGVLQSADFSLYHSRRHQARRADSAQSAGRRRAGNHWQSVEPSSPDEALAAGD